MKAATALELADLLRRDKEALLSDWEAQVRRLPREDELSAPVLRDHVPVVVDELIRNLENFAASARTASVSRIHGEQRQAVGVNLSHVIDEYKMLYGCMTDRAERAGFAVAGEAGRLLHIIIQDGIKTAIEAYVEQRDEDERARREEYLTFIVHDLRSPLTAIYNAMLLLEKHLATAGLAELDLPITAAVKRNIGRMQALIVKVLQEEQNIRIGSKIELHRSRCHLRTIVEMAIEVLSPSAASSETAIVNQVSGDIVVDADRECLERVLQNLISNAVDYTPKGTVTVGAAVAEDGGLECWVADNGQGIPDEIKPNVFEKFHTSRRRRGGLGLGLAVVKQIIEAHGGTVQLESQRGQGTSIRFWIPGERTSGNSSETRAAGS